MTSSNKFTTGTWNLVHLLCPVFFSAVARLKRWVYLMPPACRGLSLPPVPSKRHTTAVTNLSSLSGSNPSARKCSRSCVSRCGVTRLISDLLWPGTVTGAWPRPPPTCHEAPTTLLRSTEVNRYRLQSLISQRIWFCHSWGNIMIMRKQSWLQNGALTSTCTKLKCNWKWYVEVVEYGGGGRWKWKYCLHP